MKPYFLNYFILFMFAKGLLTAATYQTINFGTIPGLLKDGDGIDLDGTFTAQLGTFDGGFLPTSSNTDLWGVNWKVFSETAVNTTGEGPNIQMGADILYNNSDSDVDGYSSDLNADAYNFSNQQAWLWVKNGEDIQTTDTEWFLATLSTWMFPDVSVGGDCCPVISPANWSLPQLNATSDIPVWGSQDEWEGGGTASVNDSSYNLQTHAIPEPQTWVLMATLVSTMLLGFTFRKQGRA